MGYPSDRHVLCVDLRWQAADLGGYPLYIEELTHFIEHLSFVQVGFFLEAARFDEAPGSGT